MTASPVSAQQHPALSRKDQIVDLYRSDALVAAAVELHRFNGLPWPETLESLVLALVEDRARLQAELTAALRSRPPTVFALPATDHDGACLSCAENPCVGGHP